MKVLLDECSPAPIKRAVQNSQVFTIEEAGLKGLSNGDLIAAAEGKYDVLITADKNLRYQQSLTTRAIAIIELPHNSWPRLKTLMPILEATISRAKPGDYLIIPPTPSVLP
jgi:hypothetical protein